ncbi:MAG TPA: class I SAM-dependent methyltransferase [Candidatus Dormibacteraeota bacterium]|nr:class I SAM-dependent methyltransferase [Candidatus Dormibacteraeota bacterium]
MPTTDSSMAELMMTNGNDRVHRLVQKLRRRKFMIYGTDRFVVIGHRRRDRIEALARRLAEGGATVEHTPSFTVCRTPWGARPLILHTYDAASIDEDLPPVIKTELGELEGLIESPQAFGDLLFSIIASVTLGSDDIDCSGVARERLGFVPWRYYGRNTMARLRRLLEHPPIDEEAHRSHIVQFAAIYGWVLDNLRGASYLDVGTSLGFLPFVLSEQRPWAEIVGCDNRPEVIDCARDVAKELGYDQVRFSVRDVRDPEFCLRGRFDTVIAVHLLEHMTVEETRTATANLLGAARKRLILVVPYEKELQPLYGHQQVFTGERLEALGGWCVDHLRAAGFWIEEVQGGGLVIEQPNALARS